MMLVNVAMVNLLRDFGLYGIIFMNMCVDITFSVVMLSVHVMSKCWRVGW
jgi:hypothetical protein